VSIKQYFRKKIEFYFLENYLKISQNKWYVEYKHSRLSVYFLWKYFVLNETTNGCPGFTYNQIYFCKYYNQSIYNELPTNLDDQPRVKTPPLKVLYNKAVNCKYYVLSMVERYLEEKTEVLEVRSFPSASLPRHKLNVKWYEIETRYSAVRSWRLTVCYVHGTAYIIKFQNGYNRSRKKQTLRTKSFSGSWNRFLQSNQKS
jgi:hypothetical protein